MGGETLDTSIVTPTGAGGLLARLFSGPALPAFFARLGAALARRKNRPFRLGKRVIAARHDHVRELLVRDLDFGIAAVNEARIAEVNGGPFILGMDRSAALELERRALYEALAAIDMSALRDGIAEDIAARLGGLPAAGMIDAVGGYARPVAARTARRLFGIAGPNERMFVEVVRSVFAHTFLNLGNDKAIRNRAVKAGAYMQLWFADEIARRRAEGTPGADLMGRLIEQGLLGDDGIRRTLSGMLVGSIDTTASCVARIIWLAGRDRDLAAGLARDLDAPERVHGWCDEALRRWPHNPIVLRKANGDTSLGGRDVRTGDSVIAWTQAAMLDASVFPDPRLLRPDRDRAAYLHLGGGVHPCAGRPVNRFQIPLLVAGLVRRGPLEVGRMGWAGPFPHRLPVTLGSG
jgi:cytochrome P450